MNELIEKMRGVLADLSDHATYHELPNSDYWDFGFVESPGSDYRFVVTLYLDDGEVQIRAKRLAAPDTEYFWYRPYEPAGYDALEQLHETALADIHKLLEHETRVRHQWGLLFPKFRCEYKVGEEWIVVGWHGYFRLGGFNAPSRKIGTEWHSFPRLNPTT